MVIILVLYSHLFIICIDEIDYKCLQPILNLVGDSEYGDWKCDLWGRECLRWHEFKPNRHGRGVKFGTGTVAGIIFLNGSGNVFITDDGVIDEGIVSEKGRIEPDDEILGNLFKTLFNVLQLTNELGTRTDSWVPLNVGIRGRLDGGKHELRGDFESLEEDNKILYNRFTRTVLLSKRELFEFIGVIANDSEGNSFDNPFIELDWYSGNFPLVVGDEVELRIGGDIVLVINVGRVIENSDDRGGGKEAELKNKCLINCFKNSGL